jgi:hypothetical protein
MHNYLNVCKTKEREKRGLRGRGAQRGTFSSNIFWEGNRTESQKQM